jgi:hypothetical protein
LKIFLKFDFFSCQLAPKEFLGKFYTDSLVHSEDSLDLLIKVIGEVREIH